MRRLILAAFAMIASAAPAHAQQGGLEGVWAFQSEPYGDERFAVSMSGAAVIADASRGRFAMRLITNEMIGERASGRSRIITAHQNCVGERDGSQLSISCEMAEPLEGYTPDAFLLQSSDGQLAGVLNGTSQVTFARMH